MYCFHFQQSNRSNTFSGSGWNYVHPENVMLHLAKLLNLLSTIHYSSLNSPCLLAIHLFFTFDSLFISKYWTACSTGNYICVIHMEDLTGISFQTFQSIHLLNAKMKNAVFNLLCHWKNYKNAWNTVDNK